MHIYIYTYISYTIQFFIESHPLKQKFHVGRDLVLLTVILQAPRGLPGPM